MWFGGRRDYNNDENTKKKEIIQCIEQNDEASLSKFVSVDFFKNSVFFLDVNVKDAQKEEKDDNLINDRISLLHAAAYYDSLECFVYLIEEHNFDIRTLSTKSFLPLHYACYNSSREVAAFILSTDSSQVSIPNDNTLFNFTIYGGDVTILEALFNEGAVIKKNTRDDPLEKAIALDNMKMVIVILKHYEGYKKQSTPALMAAETCNVKLLEYLVKSSADLSYNNEVNDSVFTLMFKFSDGSDYKEMILNWLYKFGNSLEIDPPVDPNKHVDGVIQWVCKLADPEIASLMLNTQNVCVNRIGANNHIAPYYLTSNKKVSEDKIISILQILIDKGYDINYRPPGSDLETTLEVFVNSIFSLKLNVIRFLIERKANPYMYISKNKKMTIYEFAEKNKNTKLLEIFSQVNEKDFENK